MVAYLLFEEIKDVSRIALNAFGRTKGLDDGTRCDELIRCWLLARPR